MEETVDYRIPMLGPPPPEYMMTEVFVPQNDRSFVAVWDSGAKPNLVKLSLYRAHEDVKKKDSTRQRDVPSPLVPHNVTVSGILDAEPVKALGLAKMTFIIGGKQFTGDCFVFEDHAIHFPGNCDLLIGTAFMRTHKLDLSFQYWRVHLKQKPLVECLPTPIDDKQVHDIAGVVDQPINANCGDAPMTCSSDVAFNSVADKEDTVVIVSTGVYTLPAGKASIILGSLKQKDERLKNGTSILISGLPLGENCIVIPVVAKAEDVVKVLVCNFGRTPFLVHSKRTIANAVSIQDDEEEQLGRLPTDHWEKQRVLTRMSINAVVTEVKPDDVEEEDPLDQALQIDPCCVVKNGPVYDEKRFQKLLKALDADRWILKEDQRKAAESMIWEFQEAFNLKEEPLGRTNLVEHKIETGDSDRVYVPPRFIPYALRPAVEAEVQALKEQGHIRVSSSEWNAPIVLVKRKDKSHPRLCVDYRALNSQTKLEFYPLPLIEDILYQVSQSKWFSTLDLRSGYHQVPLDDDSIPKSAFTTHEGHFEYTVMPFGLSNAPRTFQRLMNRVFSGQIGQGLQLFLDDIAIYTDDIDRHLQVLKEALGRLIKAGLKASPEKTRLFQQEINLLGHRVGHGEVKAALDKLAAVKDFPTPKNRREVRRFLGLTGYYRRFIEKYAQKAQPLTKLTSEKQPFIWGSEQEEAFEVLKRSLLKEPVLRSPDFSRTWYISTDASKGAIGAILAQRYDGHFCPVSYFSRQLRGAELRYDVMEKEALAVIEALKKFKPLIWGLEVIVMSDNRSLQWLYHKAKDGNARVTRWALTAQSFGAKILYHPGKLNAAADALSRIEAPEGVDPEDIEKASTMIIDEAQNCRILMAVVANNLGGKTRQDEQEDDEEDGHPWSIDEMIREQNQDPLYSPVIKYLQTKNLLDKRKVDPNLVVEDYFLDQGLLYKQVRTPNSARDIKEVLCVPRTLVPKALALVHLAPLGGHGAEERTKFRARQNFTWRGMDRDIAEYCRKCITCAKFKGRAHPLTPLRRYPVPLEPFQMVSMDLMGPFPLTERGNQYILVIVDFLTRFAVVRALPNKYAETVAEAVSEVFADLGIPQTVLTDQGREFRNEILKEMAKHMQFQHHKITAYHPASNGLCERTNQQVLNILRGMVDGKDQYWDLYLKDTQMALNSAYHKAIGDTPYYAMYNRDLKTSDLWWTRPTSFGGPPDEDFITARTQRSKEVYEYVRDNLLRAADEQCRIRQKKSKDTTLLPGMRVFIKAVKKKGDSKLSPRWEGPFRVVEQIRPYVYRIKHLQTEKMKEVHLENMKIALEASIPRSLAPEARRPYPQETHSDIRPEGTSEEEEAREEEYVMNFPTNDDGKGTSESNQDWAQESSEVDDLAQDVVAEDSNNADKANVSNNVNVLPSMNVDESDGLQTTDSYNIRHDTNTKDLSPKPEVATNDASASTESERSNNKTVHDELSEHGRRTSGRTRYPPGYYTRLHEGPQD